MRVTRLIPAVLLLAGLSACGDGGVTGCDPGQNTLSVTPDTLGLVVGALGNLSASVLDCHGDAVADAAITYTPANPGIATVAPGGVVTGMSAGATTIAVASGQLNQTAVVEVFGHPAGTLGTPQPVLDRPFGIAVSRTGLVYVTRLDAGQLSRAAGPGQAFTSPITVGSIPTGVKFNPAGTRAYVANQDGTVSVVDASSHLEITAVPVTGSPFVVTVSPDGARAYAAGNADSVFVISTATNAVTGRVEVGLDPNGFAFSPNGAFLYVSNLSGGTVSEVNTTSLAVTRTFVVGGVPQDLAVSPDGSTLYIANENLGLVQAWNIAGNTAGPTLSIGAFGMALSPDGTQLYVAKDGNVTIVDRASLMTVTTVPVGGTARRVAFDRYGLYAVVANEGGWVDVIQ